MNMKSNLLRQNFNVLAFILYFFVRKDVACCALITFVLLHLTLMLWYLKLLANFGV